MPTPSDLSISDRVALAKGWKLSKWYEDPDVPETRSETPLHTHWYNPAMCLADRPDYVGTVAGLAELMQDLQSRRKPMSQWTWYWNDKKKRFVMRHAAWLPRLPQALWFRKQIHAVFYSPKDQPGLCVGKAWLSVFGKEAADARK